MNNIEERLARYRHALDSVAEASAGANKSHQAHSRLLTLAASFVLLAGLIGVGVLWQQRSNPHARVASRSSPDVPQTVIDVTPGTVDISTTVANTTPATLDVFAVGDSVMVGAVKKMTGAGIRVDAAESRQAKVVAEILETASSSHLLGNAVVIHAGTNGPINAETMARMMVATASVKTVVVLTVKADVAWADATNALIRGLPITHPNVVVVDWEAAASANSGLLYADGIHLKGAAGTSFYTNLILSALGRDPIP